MNEKTTNLKTIVNDFLNDRLPRRERQAFIRYYSRIAREGKMEAELIFDEIQSQIDALPEADLKRFLSKLESENSETANTKTSPFRTFLWDVRYAAAVILIVGLAFLYNRFADQNNDWVRYSAVHDELIWLPDSSSVLLKAGSELSYPRSFGKKSRTLQLSGEAFFEVRPDKERAFTVSSETGFYTRVLGTSFLMQAQPEAERVVVRTGRVEVGKGEKTYSVLNAGDSLYTIENRVVVSRKMKGSEARLLQFSNETLEAVTAALMQEFGREIVLDDSVPKGLMYTATFSSDQPLEDILKVLCDLHGLSYTVQANTISIYQ